MFCPNCGKNVPDDSKFCDGCGFSFANAEPASAPEPAAEPAPAAEPVYAQQYAQAKNVAITAVFGLVMGTVTASGIPEAIIAAVLVTVIGKALLRLTEQMKKR